MAERAEAAADTKRVVEAVYAALSAGDRAALEALVADDVVVTATAGLPLGLGGVHEGRDAAVDGFWWRIGRDYLAQAVPGEVDLLEGGRVLVRGRYDGAGRRSGAMLDAAFVHLWTLRSGQVVALAHLTDSARWRDALGGLNLETIDLSVSDGVAEICICRPEVRNAIDLRVAHETLAIARWVEQESSVRCVLIRGEGPSLSVGGDIRYFTAHAGDDMGALFKRMTTPFHQAFTIFSHIDAPIVTAAHGAVAGGGLGYVYAADIVLAAEDATFLTAFAALGVSGDGGGTWHLPRRIGPARAARAMLENRTITAAEAVDWGLVAEVVPGDELLGQARHLATRLATGPTRALGHIRRLLRETWSRDLASQLDAETAALVETGRTQDAVEAVEAFQAKRPAKFEGR